MKSFFLLLIAKVLLGKIVDLLKIASTEASNVSGEGKNVFLSGNELPGCRKCH